MAKRNSETAVKPKPSPFDNDEIKQEEDAFIQFYEKDTGHPFRLLFSLYSGQKWRMLLAAVFFVIKTSPVWVMPIITANIINIATAQAPGGLREILLNFVGIAVLLLLNIPLNYGYIHYSSIARRHVEAGLRGAMVRKLQQLTMTFHKEKRSGAIHSKIMRDVEAVELLVSQLYTTVLETAVNALVPLIVILTKNPLVFLIFLVTVPAAVLTMLPFKRRIRKTNRDFRIEMETASSEVMDMEELVPVTRAHALEEREVDKMTGRVIRMAERGYRLDVLLSFFGSVNWVVMMLFQMLCLCVSGLLAYKGRISVGEIALYQTYFTAIVARVSGVVNMMPIFTKGTESLESIGEILNAYDVEDYRGKKKLTNLRGEFGFSHVAFHYVDDDRPVLDDLDLTVKAGETVALVGESGAGKSTITNLVIGFYKPTGGTVTIDGVDVAEVDMHAFRENLAVVPQNTVLFSGTVRENITYGRPDVTEEQLACAIDAAQLRAVIDQLPDGLDTSIGEHGDKLSGGQRQRIAIARALIRDPRVIIFDEATSALDTVSERAIQKAIDNLSENRTTFIVAHRLSTIRGADKIAVIGDGKCLECGTYEELMAKKGAFWNLKQMQA